MEKRYKYMDGYLSRDLLYQKTIRLRDAAFGADCLTSFKVLKLITVGLKWILVMLSRTVTCCKNLQILIRSPLKVVVCACYGAYFVAHIFKYLAPNFASGRPVCCFLEFLYN